MKTSLQYIKGITDAQIVELLVDLGVVPYTWGTETVRAWLKKTEGSLVAEEGTLEVNHKFEHPDYGTVYLTVWTEDAERTKTASFTLGWSVNYAWIWNDLHVHTYADPNKKPYLSNCDYSPTGHCDMWSTKGDIRWNFLSNGMSLAEAVHTAFVHEGFPVRLSQLEELYEKLTDKIQELENDN